MAKKDRDGLGLSNKIKNELLNTNQVFRDLYDKIATNTYGNPMDNINQIDNMDKRIDNILDGELEELKDNSSTEELSSFLIKTLSSNDKTGGIGGAGFTKINNSEDLEAVFMNKESGIFELFNQRFRNRMLLYNDLEIITSQLNELKEAVNITRDDIVCSDEVGTDIARSLNFLSSKEGTDEYNDLVAEVKRIEKDYKLNTKIKEHIVPNTLTYGEYYVYVIPESYIFRKAGRNKAMGVNMESTDLQCLQENITVVEDPNSTTSSSSKPKKHSLDEIREYITENVKVCNEEVALPLLENDSTGEAMQDYMKFNSLEDILKPKNSSKNNKKEKEFNGFSDGVKPTNIREKGEKDFSDHKGCYIKLLDPKKVIPVKIMDSIIGYYYINDSELDQFNQNARVGAGKSNSSLFNGNMLNSIARKSTNEHNIINSIANSIVNSFDKKYLKDNAEFKEVITSCLLYNDLYKKKLHFQFIPADHICRFTVNEDANGNGVSMLWNSLFYAKLYLSILIFNVISFLGKSQDSRIHYVKNSGIDKNVLNKTMNLARQIQSKQISIADLMDYSAIFGKIGTGRDIFMPVGESGERGIEFDVIAGQNIDMQNDFMEQLKHAYISGSGVPSVITTYINEIDYAKTLVMANAKHMRRVMFYQDSFNEGITRFYKMVLFHSSDLDREEIADFEYKLSRPKTLPNNNLSDMLGYADQIMEFLIKAVYGEMTEGVDLEKDLLRKELSKRLVGVLPWEEVDAAVKAVNIEAAKIRSKKETEDDTSTDGSDGGGYGGQF